MAWVSVEPTLDCWENQAPRWGAIQVPTNGEMNKMPKYMAIHTLPEPMEGDAVAPIAKKVKANCTFDAYWVGTQVQLNDEGKVLRFICEWNAKNPEAIKKVFAKVPELPYDGIYPMTKLDSEDFI
jgi:hypothetical protein